jgi:DtxR family Mn-dependent transcriptional regulator
MELPLSQSLEDYLESIYMISQTQETVRVKDLVKRLKVRSASVIGAVRKLEDKGFVEHEHYGHIELTEMGKAEALKIYEKHRTLTRFLREILGVDDDTAEKDACMIEHYISDITYEKIIDFIHYIETCPSDHASWLQSFKNHKP